MDYMMNTHIKILMAICGEVRNERSIVSTTGIIALYRASFLSLAY